MVNKQDRIGWTALMYSVWHGAEHAISSTKEKGGMIKVLLDARADVDKQQTIYFHEYKDPNFGVYDLRRYNNHNYKPEGESEPADHKYEPRLWRENKDFFYTA